jgi:hypothetical protein
VAANGGGPSEELIVKKVHRHVPDVPQNVADRGTEIVERHFQAYGVKRAMDLPEEGKVHLMREMRAFFATEIPGHGEVVAPQSWLARWRDRVRRFFAGG